MGGALPEAGHADEQGADPSRENDGQARELDSPRRRNACGVVVTVSMEGLMAPGGVALLQERLVQRQLLAPPYREAELDAPTLAALLELQRRSDLPAVGLPSYATVRALGVEPARVFQAGVARCAGAS